MLRIEPGIDELLSLLVVTWPQLPLDATTDALERRLRDRAFGRTADPVEHVHPRPALSRGDRGGDVAVTDQQYLRTGIAELGDQRVMPVTLEDDDRDLPSRHALRLRDSIDVLRRRGVDVDGVEAMRAHGDLLHVDRSAGEEHRAAFRNGHDRNRVRLAERREPGSLEWV